VPVWQEADTHRHAGRAGDQLLVALQVDRANLLCTEIDEPEAPIVPSRGFAEDESGHQDSEIVRRYCCL